MTQLLSLKKSSGIDFLNQVNEKKIIYNHARTEKVAQRQTCVIVAASSNDLVNYQFLSMKGAGGTYISREIASLIYGEKLGALKKRFLI